jgi:protein TonB
MPKTITRHLWQPVLLAVAVGVIVSGCQTAPEPAPPAPQAPPPPPVVVKPAPALVYPGGTSSAGSARDYRKTAAHRIYDQNANRIYKGKMPPLLYAVGVLNVEINQTGAVTRVDWMRAPSHAPEVMAQIEAMVKKGAPYPAPVRLGKVTYTDTWLWHKSGQFQLDTLTEGQN